MTINTTWFDAQPPFVFALTTEGDLTVEWTVGGIPEDLQARLGIVMPAEELKILRLDSPRRSPPKNANRKKTNARLSLTVWKRFLMTFLMRDDMSSNPLSMI